MKQLVEIDSKLKISTKEFYRNRFAGQTLIETLVAIFILVMGITAALGLSIYAYASSTNITKQIIATGLAREGIEAVKNMRDTNWLKIATPNDDCYDYPTMDDIAKCYKDWLNPNGRFDYNLSPANYYKEYRLVVDPSTALFWDIKVEPPPPNGKYGLNFDNNITGVNFRGYYTTPTASGDIHGTSEYYRKLILSTQAPNSDPPFNQASEGPRLLVISQVWWTDKKCPRVQDWPGLGKCSIELQTLLTNWKNY